jgi:hypothetical protein
MSALDMSIPRPLVRRSGRARAELVETVGKPGSKPDT